MRFPNAILQLLAVGKQGAILEQSDASLLVPAVLQPLAELPAPLVTPSAITGVNNTSHIAGIFTSQNGAQAGADFASAPTFDSGVWHVRGSVSFSFDGTTNTALSTQFMLKRPNGDIQALARWAHITGNKGTLAFDHVFHFIESGYTIVHRLPATVALDLWSLASAWVASRLL